MNGSRGFPAATVQGPARAQRSTTVAPRRASPPADGLPRPGAGRVLLGGRGVSFAFLWTFIRGSLLDSLTGFRHPSASRISPGWATY